MISINVTRNAVNIDKSKHEKFQELSKGPGAPFSNMWQVFLVAACLGYQRKRRVPLEFLEKVFSWSDQLSGDDLQAIIAAIVIAHAGDPGAVADQEKMLTIVEEFANGGIDELYDQVIRAAGDRVSNLASLALGRE